MADCMVAPHSVADLVDRLRQFRLLSPAHLNEITADSHHGDARGLARSLLERGLLTPYQVNLLLQGRGAELVLDPYVVLARLGEGGAGLVLKARHLRMQRIVAIKLIRRALLTDPDVVARFHREIEIASQVSHPNVVHAFDAGPLNGTFALVMEYVEGTDLARLVKDEGPLSTGRACDYIRQAALGMQHVHERGLIHRDLKPSNLLVSIPKEGEDAAGQIKVLDLGLARLSGQRAQTASSQLTTMGSVMMGTPDYMAPEQALDLRAADIRADVYSLGCTLYFLLTGVPPFGTGSLAQKLMKHQMAPIPSVRQKRPELPEAIDTVLQKMLAKQPDDRYQTPAEVAAALAPLSGADRSTAIRRSLSGTWVGPDAVTVRQREPAKLLKASLPSVLRRRWPLRIGAAVLLFCAGLGVAFTVFSGRRQVVEAPRAATHATSDPPTIAAPRALDTLTTIGDPRGRHWSPMTSAAYSPNGKLIACSSYVTGVQIWDAVTLTEVRSLPTQMRHVNALAFSPDGKLLATCANGLTGLNCEVKIWDLANGKELRNWIHPGPNATAAAFGADDTLVTIHHKHTPPPNGPVVEFRSWDASTGKEKRPPVEALASNGARLSANAAVGLTHSANGWKQWDLAKGTSEAEGTLGPNRGMPPHTLSADGRSLLIVAQKPLILNGQFFNELHLVDLAPAKADAAQDARMRTHTLQEDYHASLIVMGPRPQTAILWGHSFKGGNTTSLRLWDVSGTTPRRLAEAPLPASVSFLISAPDGKSLAIGTHDGNLRLWDALTLVERFPDPGHRGGISSLAFTDGDQSLLSTCATDHTVRVWDHAHGKERTRQTLAAADHGLNPALGLMFLRGTDTAGLVAWNHQAVRWIDPVSNRQRDLLATTEEDGIQAAALSPDGRTLAALVSSTLKFWDTATGQARPVALTNIPGYGHMVFSHDGKLLAMPTAQTEEGKVSMAIRIVDVTTGADRAVVPSNFAGIQALTMSGDGRFVAVSGTRLDGKRHIQDWKVWEVGTGKERVLPRPALNAGYSQLMFASHGPNLAVWSHNRLEVWDVAAEKLRVNVTLQIVGGRIYGLRTMTFSRDGQRIAYSQNDGKLVLLDCDSGAAVREWKLPGAPTSLALSNDHRQIAVGSASGLIQVYRLPGTNARP